MAGNLLYVNARIKSLENGLLSQLQLSRLADAESLFDAFKILQECGYGQGLQIEDYKSYENLITLREREAVAFFKENLIDKSGMDAILLKNDYHNAKVLIKAKYMRLTEVKDMLLPDGIFDTTKMQEDIFNDDYSIFPIELQEALDSIDVAFANGNRSPRFIDITLDKAMYKDMSNRINKYGQAVLKDWFKYSVDTANISSFIRAKNLGLDVKYFLDGFFDGGKVSADVFKDLYDGTFDAFKDKMKYTDYGDLVEIALSDGNGLVKFETAVDNRMTKLFKDYKYDMFSVAPIVGYYFGQLTEIKVVKLSMSAIKNNLDKNILKQRLRELYA